MDTLLKSGMECAVKVWERLGILVKFRVENPISTGKGLGTQQVTDTLRPCSKLHDVGKRDLAKKKGYESVLERAEFANG